MADTRRLDRHVLLAGGGTGGHIFPAIALAEELSDRGWKVTFAGRAEGMEARIAEQSGLPYMTIAARPFIGRGPIAVAKAFLMLVASTIRAWREIRKLDVDVAVGTGGYVAAPTLLGARIAGRPSLILEPNARAGAANRWLSRWASEAVVSFEETIESMKCPAQVLGVPVRKAFREIAEIDPDPYRMRLLVLGGSQGALQLNQIVPAALGRISRQFPQLTVVHQTGTEKLKSAESEYERHVGGRLEISIVPFLDDMAGAMGEADLVISRAGAVTLAEICAAGRPAILIPLAIASGHQRDNAEAMRRAGAAEILQDGGEEAESLAHLLEQLLGSPERLKEMGQAARGIVPRPAAETVADRIEKLMRAA